MCVSALESIHPIFPATLTAVVCLHANGNACVIWANVSGRYFSLFVHLYTRGCEIFRKVVSRSNVRDMMSLSSLLKSEIAAGSVRPMQ